MHVIVDCGEAYCEVAILGLQRAAIVFRKHCGYLRGIATARTPMLRIQVLSHLPIVDPENLSYETERSRCVFKLSLYIATFLR